MKHLTKSLPLCEQRAEWVFHDVSQRRSTVFFEFCAFTQPLTSDCRERNKSTNHRCFPNCLFKYEQSVSKKQSGDMTLRSNWLNNIQSLVSTPTLTSLSLKLLQWFSTKLLFLLKCEDCLEIKKKNENNYDFIFHCYKRWLSAER